MSYRVCPDCNNTEDDCTCQGKPRCAPAHGCASLPETEWRPAMKSLIEWRDGLKLQDYDPEKDSLERLMFQLDGRVRYLEARHNEEVSHPRRQKP